MMSITSPVFSSRLKRTLWRKMFSRSNCLEADARKALTSLIFKFLFIVAHCLNPDCSRCFSDPLLITVLNIARSVCEVNVTVIVPETVNRDVVNREQFFNGV